jgi:hypothetical protein
MLKFKLIACKYADRDISCGLHNRMFVTVSNISQCRQQRGSCEDYDLVNRDAVQFGRYLPAIPCGRSI